MDCGGFFEIIVGVVGLGLNVSLLDRLGTQFSRAGYACIRMAVTVYSIGPVFLVLAITVNGKHGRSSGSGGKYLDSDVHFGIYSLCQDMRNRRRVSMSWNMLDALLVIERGLPAVSRRGEIRQ
jgi:hypothetical protein